MTTSKTIFLSDDSQVVNLDGMILTVSELKDAVIGNSYYQGKLSELLEGK